MHKTKKTGGLFDMSRLFMAIQNVSTPMTSSVFIKRLNNILRPYRNRYKTYLPMIRTFIETYSKRYIKSDTLSTLIKDVENLATEILKEGLKEEHFQTILRLSKIDILKKIARNYLSRDMIAKIQDILRQLVHDKTLNKSLILQLYNDVSKTKLIQKVGNVFEKKIIRNYYDGPINYHNIAFNSRIPMNNEQKRINKELVIQHVLKNNICVSNQTVTKIPIQKINTLIELCRLIKMDKVNHPKNVWRKKFKRGIFRLLNWLSKTRARFRTNPETLKNYICSLNSKNFASSYVKYNLLQAALERLRNIILTSQHAENSIKNLK